MAQTDIRPGFRLEDLINQVEGQRFPPVEKWHPPFCGNIDMRIARDGTWYYMGTPIGRERMVRLFSTVLRRDDDGRFYLVTPVEKIGIEVEDAPFVAVLADIVSEGKDQIIHFTTNVGDRVIAGPDHPIRVETDEASGEPRPYVHVRGRLEALIARPVFYQLVDHADIVDADGRSRLEISSAGASFSLGDVEGADVHA